MKENCARLKERLVLIKEKQKVLKEKLPFALDLEELKELEKLKEEIQEQIEDAFKRSYLYDMYLRRKYADEKQLEYISFFYEYDIADAKKNDKWTFIDKTGNFIAKKNNEIIWYDEYNPFFKGVAKVKKEGEEFYIDYKFERVFNNNK